MWEKALWYLRRAGVGCAEESFTPVTVSEKPGFGKPIRPLPTGGKIHAAVQVFCGVDTGAVFAKAQLLPHREREEVRAGTAAAGAQRVQIRIIQKITPT